MPKAKSSKSGKSRKAGKKHPEAGPKGRLLALEGTSGRDLEKAAKRVADLCGGASAGVGWSRWDASNTFFELQLRKAKRLIPPIRTLLLLYASDLAFRLRWEIRPALSEGRTLVVAPYVETAKGFGIAAGLPKDWLDELFAFAPRPDACFRLKEKAKAKPKKSVHGFVEFSSKLLAADSAAWNAAAMRAAILKHFDALEEGGQIRRLGRKLPK